MSVRRIFAEKKEPYAVKAQELMEEMSSYLDIHDAKKVRVLIRYDVENLSDETYEKSKGTIFSEPPVDDLYEGTFPHEKDDIIFSVEYLPGQFDQRADSAEQCVKLLKEDEQPIIRSATTYVISGALTSEEVAKLKNHCINPVDSREASEEIPQTLNMVHPEPEDVKILEGFSNLDGFIDNLALCALIHKHPTFTVEKEIRIAPYFVTDNDSHIEYKTFNIIKEFYILDLQKVLETENMHREDIINSIIIGPRSSQNPKDLENYCRHLGLHKLAQNIKVSDCPLR